MFNCDQLIPDINFQANDGVTNTLDFGSYDPNNRDESFQMLLRRHLSARRRPDGHIFYAQPIARGTKCSYYYISWYNQAFGFLRNPALFYKKIAVPKAIKTTTINTGDRSVFFFLSSFFDALQHSLLDSALLHV